MNEKDLKEDIYTIYRPKVLPTSRIREKTGESAEIEELIEKVAGKIPFDHNLVMKLENLKAGLRSKDISPFVLEKMEIILYFDRYGISPNKTLRASPKDLDRTSWKALLVSLLGGFPVCLCNKRADLLSRVRYLLKAIFNKKGKIPCSSDLETISLSNAIRRGVYEEMGIVNWDDLMFMTFGRNYFKHKVDMKMAFIPDEEDSRSTRSFFKTRKKDVLSLVQWYQTALSLDDTLQPDISRTFDLLFRSLPKGSLLKRPNYLAEITIFHVLKEKRRFTDWDLFELISPLGDMPMGSRIWLLRYKQYLPSNRTCFPDPATPDLYLGKLYGTSKITETIKKECEKNKLILVNNFKCIKPRTIAGMACYLALKKYPERLFPINEALARMGIGNTGSIINALKRLKTRREYHDELFTSE